MEFNKKAIEIVNQAHESLFETFEQIHKITEYNQQKVLEAFYNNKIGEEHFYTVTGYGHDDMGREALDKVFADVFGAESAIVRPHFVSGSHTIACALFGVLRYGDRLVSIAGEPYDTMQQIIGSRPNCDDFDSSLMGHGVKYSEVPLKNGVEVDYENIEKAINEKTKLVTIQRSKGYQTRPTLSVTGIGELISFIKKRKPDVICMVDNCYGEFVETVEPSDFGADMIVGSLIKNPGGGLAPIGGYIAGTNECIERCAYRLNAPGLGKEVGATLGLNQTLYQGFFLAPTVTAGALKGALFASAIYEKLGFKVIPNSTESRHDIIQAIDFGSPEHVIAFCKGIQSAAPVDSHVDPEPWDMPGYDAPVIMAAGAFIQGSSIELSADGPIKPPYSVFFQGGLTWYHAKFGIIKSLQKMTEAGLIKL